MDGIHIVAFAEEDDPGRRPLSSFYDSPSLEKIQFHVLCSHCGVLHSSQDGEPQPVRRGNRDVSGC